MTSPDWTAEAQEAIWEASKQYGVRLEVSEQVAVARDLARLAPGELTPLEIQVAFRRAGLREPSTGFAEAVLKGIRLDTRVGLLDVILEFRGDAIRSLSREYGGKPKPESQLRDYLLMYLPQRGYKEAHTGRGQTDILLPKPEDAVIETKVWTTPQEFDDGIVELREYIRTEKPKQAIFVLFGDREPLPSLVADHRRAVVDERDLEGLKVPVVAVLFDVTPPSRVARTQRRRSHGR